ncbi:MAG TPA: GTP-binding protein [Coleofasciculaceae cyanobacterium]
MTDQTTDHPSDAANSAGGLVRSSLPDFYFNRAKTSLKQAMNRYTHQIRMRRRHPDSVELQAAIKTDLDRLANALEKLDQSLIRMAVFGLVSRGKSAVINALLGQKILQTGPLHGVTQYPRSVYWSATRGQAQVELIDTPGLDEVGGELRATMAREVVEQADLILFVISGDITRTEYQALRELQAAHKPIILIFNKIDLYPDQDRQTVYRKLQARFAQSEDRPFLTPEDIVLVAAEPAPVEVRVEWPDGQITHEWESPLPQIDPLKDKLLEILNREGKSLLALNALRQARDSESAIARKVLKLQRDEAEDLIWRFAKWKAIAIAANPFAILDLIGGAAVDLVMIRALAKLYGLPMTRHEAEKLLKSILFSSGGLLLSEVGTGMLMGIGKSASALATAFDSASGLAAYSATAIAQASMAGYGSHRVGKAAQIYLEQGCTWGPQGANTVIQEILAQADASTVIYRLRRELGEDAKR